MKKNKINLCYSDRVFHFINYSFLTLWLLAVVFPLLNIVSQSLSSPSAVVAGRVFFWPIDFSLNAYLKIFNHPDLVNGFLNSVFYTGVGTVVNVILTIMAAYPLSRKDLYGRNVIIGMFVFTMLFNGGIIPSYLLVKSLHLYDTRWALILPNALAVYNVLIARSFFQNTIPDEMYEAAEIDGASDFQVLRMIVLPLALPIVAVLTLFYAVSHWNAFFNGLIYLSSKELLPLQVVLRNILSNAQELESMANLQMNATDAQNLALVEVLKYAIIVLASLPMLMIYPFVQKYFVKGIMIGSLKG